MKSNVVKLNWQEVMLAAINGISRRVESRKQGLDASKTKSGNIWESDIIGALGEVAFAKYAGLYNSYSINTFKKPDIGVYQVRSTSHDNGHLIIYENDSDNDPYVLMTGICDLWTVRGWITGKQGKAIGIKKNETQRWVQIEDLEDISTLPKSHP